MRNYKEILKNEKFLSDTFDTWEEMENHFILENLKGVIKIFEQLESVGISCKLCPHRAWGKNSCAFNP